MPADHTFRIYNSLTRAVEPVEPREPGHLRFYTCGPTVYSYAHIGNFRSFLTADLILRTARAIGWKTTFVTNVTDVGHLTEDDYADAGGEDRMAKALRSKEGEQFANVWDLARYYTEVMLADWQALNLSVPDVRPRATEHIAEQIRAIEQLVERGHAYVTSDAVYFSVPSFPEYGKLSGNVEAEQLEMGTRDVVQDPEKRDPRDFALWKRDPSHLMQWHSPWGWGFPGWHIECSAMSMKYLGPSFDLHTGGEDNRFPHHECEIAQSESLTGQPFARYWVHTRFLLVEGEKMAKRKGNFFTVRDLILPEAQGGRGVDPLALRLALISGQYRNLYNFTLDNLKASLKHVQRFREADTLTAAALAADAPGEDRIGPRLDALYDRVLGAMLDDLNTPEAIAAALEGARLIQGFGAGLNAASARSARGWLDRVNALLGIVRPDAPAAASAAGAEAETDAFAREVEQLLAERTEARKTRNFARADAIRAELDARGIEVMDGPEGSRWRKKIELPSRP